MFSCMENSIPTNFQAEIPHGQSDALVFGCWDVGMVSDLYLPPFSMYSSRQAFPQ